jgi:hypothetical protein
VSTAGAETLLADALRREWLAQSGGEEPLVVTDAVREAVELAVAATGGALDVAAALPGNAASPEDLLNRLRDWLPDRLDPWSARTLRRVTEEPVGSDPARAVHEVPFLEPLAAADAPEPQPAEPAGAGAGPPRGRAAAAGAAVGALLALVAGRRR